MFFNRAHKNVVVVSSFLSAVLRRRHDDGFLNTRFIHESDKVLDIGPYRPAIRGANTVDMHMNIDGVFRLRKSGRRIRNERTYDNKFKEWLHVMPFLSMPLLSLFGFFAGLGRLGLF